MGPVAVRRSVSRTAITSTMISNKDSDIKARYALTVLRVAQAADRETAARLVQSLARDFPHPEERRMCGLYQAAQRHSLGRTAGRFDCVECLAPVHSWSGSYDYTVWRRVSLGRTTNPKLRDAIAG
jgi:hypothetical protein